jgi:hypothetical protein
VSLAGVRHERASGAQVQPHQPQAARLAGAQRHLNREAAVVAFVHLREQETGFIHRVQRRTPASPRFGMVGVVEQGPRQFAFVPQAVQNHFPICRDGHPHVLDRLGVAPGLVVGPRLGRVRFRLLYLGLHQARHRRLRSRLQLHSNSPM